MGEYPPGNKTKYNRAVRVLIMEIASCQCFYDNIFWVHTSLSFLHLKYLLLLVISEEAIQKIFSCQSYKNCKILTDHVSIVKDGINFLW